MVRFALALLAVAVRRWPVDLRADLRREWLAELHVLAADGRDLAMLRYAASLAMAGPTRRELVAVARGTWHAARLVLVAPVLAIVLVVAGFAAAGVTADRLLTSLGMAAFDLQSPLLLLFCLGSAALLALLGRRWTAGAGSLPLVPAVTVPGCLAGVLLTGDKPDRFAAAYIVFFAGLGLVLTVVRRLAAAGRTWTAWLTGVVGATLSADVAVMLPLWANAELHHGLAPVWLFSAVFDSEFGLPLYGHMDVFVISDIIILDPPLFIVFTGFALGAVTAAGRARVTGAASAPAEAG